MIVSKVAYEGWALWVPPNPKPNPESKYPTVEGYFVTQSISNDKERASKTEWMTWDKSDFERAMLVPIQICIVDEP